MIEANTKNALVTGSGRGLGAFLARALAKIGYRVAIHYCSSRQDAMGVADQIHADGGSSQVFQADLSLPVEVSRMIAAVHDWSEGNLDVLVNNAGVYEPVSLETLTAEQWFRGLNTTATATFLTTQACIPLLRRCRFGRIVNIGDSSADRPTARDQALGYHVGKTGVWMLTRSYAQSEAHHGITVNMISPGYLENSLGLPPKSTIPAGRFGTNQDVWGAVKFLVSEHSQYVTGTDLMVTGGWNLR